MVRRFFSILAAVLFMAGAATPAWSALADLGIPIAPHGYPAFYEDGNELQLELCVPPPAGNATRDDLCLFDDLDLDSDIFIAGESFWWAAEAEIALPNDGDALLVLAIEGTFGGSEEPVDGQQISFGRTRIRIDTPVAGTYTVTHPYGTHVFENVPADDRGINFTADIGSANFLFPAAGFRGTLTAPIGPFLTWPDYDTNPALQVPELDENDEPTGVILEQYVGNPNEDHTVVGGPNGNVFRIEGPEGANLDGQGGNVVETDLFSVMGKVFDSTAEFVAHVFPGVPEQKLLAVGPVNRVVPYVEPTTGEVTGEEFDYALGYPLWYQENLGTLEEPEPGIQLTLCTPGDAMCISDPIDPVDPLQADLRTGGESFWWSADASIENGDDDFDLILGLEATFGGDESLADGQQISFGRERIRIDTNVSGEGTYRITHPYAVRIFENVPADDRGINFTADIGIADLEDPDGAFVGTLYSDIGPTFLKWDTFDPNPESTDPLLITPSGADPELFNYHVGNPGIEHEVVGSPLGTNFFRVEKLDGDDWVLLGETDLFAVSGKVYDPATFEFSLNAAAPVAVNDTTTMDLRTAQGTSISIDVAANDTIPVGAPATFTIIDNANDGNAVVENPSVGSITYSPDADFALEGGVDTFTYQISQTSGDVTLTSGIATVTVTVIPEETITVDRARFRTRNLRLDLRGASNFPGTTLTLHAGATAAGEVIGSVSVDDRGRWSFRGTATTNMTEVTLVSNSAETTTVTQSLDVR